jgi:hypothetical protein
LKRQSDPISTIRHRWYNVLRKAGLTQERELWSRETVTWVWDRCEGKSVLSGEQDYHLLCIVSMCSPPGSKEDLVLVTSTEARQLARMSNTATAKVFQAIE